MPDPQFGVFLSPDVEALPHVTEQALAAEAAGFDYVSVQDHPYVPQHVDTLALITHLAARTTRIRFMTNVANLPLRPAPMLAKTSAAIDLLSGGRFDLGLGGGRLWDRIAALGGPRWTPGETVAATGAAIDTIRAVWDGGPRPAHRIGIWLGAAGPRMLDLLGTKADGWVAPLSTPFESKPAAQERIDAAARAAGRTPAEVRRAVQLVGLVGSGVATRPLSGPGNTPIRADAESWTRIITEFVTEGRFDTVNLVLQGETLDQLQRFGGEVILRVRAALREEAG